MKKIFFTSLFCLFLAGFASAQSHNSSEKGSLNVQYDAGIESLQQKYIAQNKHNHKLSGYRIQVFNGNKGACEKVRSRYLSIFGDQKVHTVYESPEYKVQVGDFRTKLEAEKYLEQILNDFSGSFVVKSSIEYPSLE